MYLKMYQQVIATLCLCFLLLLLHLFNKLWLTPRRLQKLMASRGIKGPPYRFIHGNTKEMMSMRQEASATPMDLSHHVFPKVAAHVYSCINLYGTIYVQWIGLEPELVVAEPELVKAMLNDKDGDYPKGEPRGLVKKLLGDGLVASRGEKWQKQRKLANHAFHGENLKVQESENNIDGVILIEIIVEDICKRQVNIPLTGMTPNMIVGVEMMLERWKSYVGKEIEVFQEFKLLTSEVISRTAFGNSYLEGENLFHMLTRLIQIVSRNAFRIKIPIIESIYKTKDDTEANKLEQGIRNSVIKVIKTREESVKSGKEESYGSDFLGSLLNAYHNDDKTKKISLDDLVDECKTFYIAGQEATLTLLSWIVLVLAVHTEWQDKARMEVLESFGQEHPNPQGITRLTTMGMIINETLRLYSPVVGILRKVGREVRIGDVIIPENMNINISTIALQHSTKIWGEDAHLFKPERFAEGVAKATNNNIAAFIPFGLGPRNCVGLNFATNETKITMSMILQRYKFTLSPNYVHCPVHIVTVRPQHGLQIILHKL